MDFSEVFKKPSKIPWNSWNLYVFFILHGFSPSKNMELETSCIDFLGSESCVVEKIQQKNGKTMTLKLERNELITKQID